MSYMSQSYGCSGSNCSITLNCSFTLTTSFTTSFQESSRLEYIASSHNASCGSSCSISYSITSSSSSRAYQQPVLQPSFISRTSQQFYHGTAAHHSTAAVTSHSYSQDNNPVYNLFHPLPEYHFQPDDFLIPSKGSKFVSHAEEVHEYVEKAFEKIFNQPFPDDIKISILEEKRFRKITPSLNTIGLSINRSQHGLISEIFIKNDYLGRVMLTIGHELGHVLSPALDNKQDEEAKAYAFSFAWMEIIKEHNIANLANAIVTESPAQNGLHDVGFALVMGLFKQGENYLQIYKKILNKKLSTAK